MSARDFLSDFHEVAKIGATPRNGVDRQAATPEDKLTRDWFRRWAEERDFQVRTDGIGNMFACWEWVPGAPYILIGSHLDSQPLAGRFDGAYGVLAGLHAASSIIDRVKVESANPTFNLAVVNWFNEEGSRFPPSVMGSSVFTGIFEGDDMRAVRDLDGVSVVEALESIGYLGTDVPPVAAGYAEIHIEQGRILEREQVDIGVVDSSWYTQKLDIEVLGEQSHTGATAMADRRDALVAASRIVLSVRNVTLRFPEEALVSSVGHLVVEPNSPIVVARRVHLVADIRSADPNIVAEARRAVLEDIAAIEQQDNVEVRVKDFDIRPIRRFPEDGISLAEAAVATVGLASRRMQTMAGHDSVAMNTRVPSIMMFVPSVDGVSHCEREFTNDDDLERGLRVLTEVTWRLIHGAIANDRVWPSVTSASETDAL
ncbi:M20 family metallo-hydrolase [Microbacterium forte]|uniref:M20 family metallo-hydrolase n=1 Tax=Microbacterium forte TaxID=2982533 RepID=UPI0028929E1D|nr:M20 family metallo-hydrolase [Microbacterium sp. A(2022)]